VSLYFSIKNSPDLKTAAMAADLNHARMPIEPAGKPTEVGLAINAMAFKHTKYPNAAKAYLQFMMEASQYDKWLTDSFGYRGQPLRAYEASDVWKNDTKMVDMVASVNSGDATPEEAAREAERRAKRYYKA